MREYDSHLVAERLKELRNERHVGQNALAAALSLSNASISYWENGKQEPGAAALMKLAQFFEVSVDYLLGLEDSI
ncbi:MAG: helix-turn-helix domain-containing protein [Clostridiales bacterium]|jgi:transcriptional regulator with XRE-family HTH domain|nr:helix-turn-helix domain-containing protein [Clostridiales bacterium]